MIASAIHELVIGIYISPLLLNLPPTSLHIPPSRLSQDDHISLSLSYSKLPWPTLHMVIYVSMLLSQIIPTFSLSNCVLCLLVWISIESESEVAVWLHNSMDPVTSALYAYGIFQSRVLKVGCLFLLERSSFQDWTQRSPIVGRCFTIFEPPGSHLLHYCPVNISIKVPSF